MSHRLEKINELLKHEIGRILLTEEEFGPDVLVTILKVDTAQDLRDTNITFSVLPTEKGPVILKKLNADAFNLRELLKKRLKMHPVPKIRFVLNENEAESQKVESLIKKIQP